MPINLEKPAKDVDITSAEYASMLANLQSNILRAHGRNFARHVFLQFTAQPADVKTWIRDSVEPLVTTAKEQFDQIARRRDDPSFDGGLVGGFFLSANGYEYLAFDPDRFASEAFRKGMKNRDGRIPNVLKRILDTNNKDPEPDHWEGGFQKEVHALITLADSTEAVVKEAVESIRASFGGLGNVLTIEEGIVLRRKSAAGDDEPIEHFGYFDGISNPLFTKQDFEDEREENKNRKAWNAEAPLSLVVTRDPFTNEEDAFGSYLVYRKLGQDVRAFDERVESLAAALNTSEELAGAMVIGRFKDGTPVVKTHFPSPGPQLNNDFNFKEDEDGLRCPFHAHIRKVNPRGTTPLTSLDSERSRRIVRRGIPYGKPMPGVADHTEVDADPAASRGLLFMCFQANVEKQFEFIQRTWVDNEHFPSGVLTFGIFQKDTGDDPLIGQDRDESQRWPKSWGNRNLGKKSFNFESAITLKGGEYFFAPSIPFLRSL
jgi:Dyp-type peroxidase family